MSGNTEVSEDAEMVRRICGLLNRYYKHKGVDYEESKFEEWADEQVNDICISCLYHYKHQFCT